MKTIKKHSFFILLLIIATVVYILQQLEITIPTIINNYLNDFLAVPLTCWIILIIIRHFKERNFILSPLMIIVITMYFSFYFEWYLPQFNPRYTSDYMDVICYTIGGFTYYSLQKRLFFTKTKIDTDITT